MKHYTTIFFSLFAIFVHAQNWSKLQTSTLEHLDDLAFFNDTVGYIAGGISNPMLLKTTDGIHLSVVDYGSAQALNSISLVPDDTVYISGMSGFVSKSYDGGTSWIDVSIPGAGQLNTIHFLNSQVGFAGGVGGDVYKTIDGGTNWTMPYNGTTYQINEIYFVDELHGFACGDYGVMTYSADGGDSWTEVTSNASGNIFHVHFPTTQIGYACSTTGDVIKSIDGGLTWTNLNVGVSSALRYVTFLSELEGYISGNGGLILRTFDGGSTWDTLCISTVESLQAINFTSPTNAYAVGFNGTAFRFLEPIAQSFDICSGDSILIGGQYQKVPGLYYDTLQTVVSGCDSILTYNVLIDSLGMYHNTVSGIVYFQNSPITSGQVRLIKKDANSPQSMYDVDSVDVASDGSFIFENIEAGNYLVKALGDTSLYDNVATYGDSTNHWQKANVYDLTQACRYDYTGANIYLIDFPTTIGFGNIDGSITHGGPGRAGDPISGVDVTLMSLSNEVVAFDVTDINGNFSFKKLSENDYFLLADIPGYVMDTTKTIHIASGDNAFNVQLCAIEDSAAINVCAISKISSVVDLQNNDKVNIYPNPTSDKLTIEFKGFKNAFVTIYDITGKVIYRSNELKSMFTIDVSTYDKGVYFIDILDLNKDVISKQKVVIK